MNLNAITYPASKILLSFALVCSFVVVTFLLGAYVHQSIWLVVSWPALLARTYDGGIILHGLESAVFRRDSQGAAHYSELLLIFVVWWPVAFIFVHRLMKRKTSSIK